MERESVVGAGAAGDFVELVRRRVRTLAQAAASPAAGDGTASLAGVCWTVLALDGSGLLAATPRAAHTYWIDRILDSQRRPEGWFAEDGEGVRSGSPGEAAPDAGAHQTTGLALQALDALGVRPRNHLGFADEVADPRTLGAWLERLDWTRPVDAASQVSGLLAGLVYRAEEEADRRALAAYHDVLDHLTGTQDARTGLWGPAGSASPAVRVEAAYRIVPYFGYVRRPLQRVSRLVDAVLDVVRSEFENRKRGAHPELEMAATWLLAALRPTGVRGAEIDESLLELQRLVRSRIEDGGPNADHVSPSPSGAGSAPGGVARGCGDVEALGMNLLTLAATVAFSGDGGCEVPVWRFRRRPGPGCRVFAGRLTDHERGVLPLWIRPSCVGGRGASTKAGGGAASPAVSVVVPCHDLGAYLPEALGSVAAQTTGDLEIIVVDDGSTDEFTRLVLDHVAGRGTRVIRQRNAGVAAARNRGIEEARGRYICCLDPDDRIRSTFLARAIEILDTDAEVGLVSGQLQTFDERDEIFRSESVNLPELLVQNCVAVEAAVFRRAAWEHVDGYWGGFSAGGIEDWDLWIRIVKAGYRAVVLPEVVWDYRIRPGQMSEGMYRPETWGRLCRELAVRHADSYRDHLADVVGAMAKRWAELRAYAQDSEAAVAWWTEQAERWQRTSAEAEAAASELRSWAGELERALTWWEAQSREWQERAERANARLEDTVSRSAELKARGVELGRAASWWAEEAEAARRSAADREARIVELEAWAGELAGARQWWEDQSAAWEKIAAERQARIDALEAELDEARSVRGRLRGWLEGVGARIRRVREGTMLRLPGFLAPGRGTAGRARD